MLIPLVKVIWCARGKEITRSVLFSASEYDSSLKKRFEMDIESIANSELVEALLHKRAST